MAKNRKNSGRSEGKMSLSEAGKKGGETVKQKYGEGFYSDIGKKGGETRGRQR